MESEFTKTLSKFKEENETVRQHKSSLAQISERPLLGISNN
jgi:hypothetical protein